MWFQERLNIATKGRGMVEISRDIESFVASSGATRGLCHLFLQHTSASLILCENADSDVRADLELFMGDFVSDGDSRYTHIQEGPDDMPAHIRSVITQSEMTIPIDNGSLALGIWQGVYLWEHRTSPHRRILVVPIHGPS